MPGPTPSNNEVDSSRALIWDPAQGKAISIPNTDVPKARAAGYELALPVRDKDNNLHMVPQSKVRDAIIAGNKVDLNAVDQTHVGGFWSNAWDDVKAVVPGALRMAGAAVAPVTVLPPRMSAAAGGSPTGINVNRAVQENVGQADENYKRETAEGRAPAYKAAAAVGQVGAGVNVQAMEHAANEGDTGGVVGRAVVPVTMAASPYIARAAVKPIGAMGDFAQVYANRMYQGALDLPKNMPLAEQEALAKTGVNERITLNKSGLDKSQTKAAAASAEMERRVAQNPDATIDPNDVAKYTEPVKEQAGKSVNPNDDVAAVKNATEEYLAKHGKRPGTQPSRQAGFTGGDVPGKPATPAQPYSVAEAAAEKSATLDKVGDNAGTFTKKTQAAMADGIRDNIVKQFPELGELGAKEKALLDLNPHIEKIIAQEVKRPSTPSLKDLAIGAAVEHGTGSFGTGTAAVFMNKLLRSPAMRSRMAIAINETGKVAGGMKGAFAKYDAWVNGLDDQSKEGLTKFNKDQSGTFGLPGEKIVRKMVDAMGPEEQRLGRKLTSEEMDQLAVKTLTPEELKHVWGSEAIRADTVGDFKKQFNVPETKTVTNNASGESSASVEAINRAASEKSQGIKRFKIDTRSGKEIPLIGVDAVDVRPGQYEVIVQRGPKGETLLDQGSKANYKPVPAWPENYKPTTLKKQPSGGGANFTEAELAEFKRKHNIK